MHQYSDNKAMKTVLLTICLLVSGVTFADTRELVIIHTNDFHGHIKEEKNYAGAARISAFVKKQRQNHPGVLFLDAGDAVSGTPVSTMFKGLPIFHVMNAMGYDVGLIGNHEFDQGYLHIRKFREIANHPLLGANEFSPDKKLISDGENRLMDINGIRVGIIGLITELTPSMVTPTGNEGVTFLDPLEVLREQVALVRPLVDILIVLSHVGFEPEKKLAKEVAGVDLIVGAHSHTLVDPIIRIGDTYITQANRYGTHVGYIQLSVDTDKNKITRLAGGHPIPASELPAPDANVLKLVNYWEDKVKALVDVEIAYAHQDLSQGELQVLFERVIAQWAKADFGYYNIDGIRDSISMGPVTARHFWNIEPFENKLVTMTIKGSDYLKLLGRENENHSSIPSVVPERTYKIATNSYIGAHATKAFGQDVIVTDLGVLIRDVLIKHVKNEGL